MTLNILSSSIFHKNLLNLANILHQNLEDPQWQAYFLITKGWFTPNLIKQAEQQF
ncbi:hypothetical protein [Thalassoporum mexicanum]|nr:hypothetical protein [Pseudanabaena sp. PCC 7367]